jgi:TolA-binding protein
MRITLLTMCALMAAAMFAGCGRSSKSDLPVWQSNKRLLQQRTELENQMRTLEAENKQLKQQVETLGSLDKNTRLESLYDIQSINIGSSTGIYTKEQDKTPRLVVYFSPIDKTGDSIKASGSAEVELWNLAAKENESLVGKWQIGPDKLKKDWGIGLMTAFYRLSIDLPENTKTKGDFVVRLSFTDYLSGKILTARQAISRMNL